MHRTTLPAERRSIRLYPLFLIGLIGGGSICIIQLFGMSVFRPAWDLAIVICLTNLAIYCWIRAISRLSWYGQMVAIAVMIITNGALLATLRLDGFAGDGRMIFVWRWRATPEELLSNSFMPASPAHRIADLSKTSGNDWPCFRGVDRSGFANTVNLSTDWRSNPPQELWRRPIGRGWSSFAVVGEYCITQEQRNDNEMVVCYELRTGIEVWTHSDRARFIEVTGGDGPRATPAIYNGRVYSLGATGILNCLDGADGRTIWTQQIDAAEKPPLFGFSSSPLIHGPYVYIMPGGRAGSLVAYDRADGTIAWTSNARKSGYSSPDVFGTGDTTQILVFDAIGLHGHDATSGQTLWSFPWGDDSDDRVNVCQPVLIQPNSIDSTTDKIYRILISSGYGRGSALLSITSDAKGQWRPRTEWQSKSLRSKFSSIVVRGGFAYGLDQGILTCISLEDGSRRWKSGHYGYGQLILVNDLLLIQAESGAVAIVSAEPTQFNELATMLALSDRTWNHPVVAGRYLLVRNDREAACFELPVQTSFEQILEK